MRVILNRHENKVLSCLKASARFVVLGSTFVAILCPAILFRLRQEREELAKIKEPLRHIGDTHNVTAQIAAN